MQQGPTHRLHAISGMVDLAIELIEAEQLGLVRGQSGLGVGEPKSSVEFFFQLEEPGRSFQRVVARRQSASRGAGVSQQFVGPMAVSTPGDEPAQSIHVGAGTGDDAALDVLNDAPLDFLESHRFRQ